MADYWAEITAVYHSLPDYLAPKDKWDMAYARMRELKIQPINLPIIPQGNTFVREYAMAIHAMMVHRWNQLVLSKHFLKEWK